MNQVRAPACILYIRTVYGKCGGKKRGKTDRPWAHRGPFPRAWCFPSEGEHLTEGATHGKPRAKTAYNREDSLQPSLPSRVPRQARKASAGEDAVPPTNATLQKRVRKSLYTPSRQHNNPLRGLRLGQPFQRRETPAVATLNSTCPHSSAASTPVHRTVFYGLRGLLWPPQPLPSQKLHDYPPPQEAIHSTQTQHIGGPCNMRYFGVSYLNRRLTIYQKTVLPSCLSCLPVWRPIVHTDSMAGKQ
jgi:hypothetical protein